MHGIYIYAHARFDDLDLMQGHSGSAKATFQCSIILTTKQAISIELPTTVDHFLHDLDFANMYYVWLEHLFFLLRAFRVQIKC